MADVEFRDLSKSFGRHKILDNISLDIKTASSSCWSARPGCGKSTLLRMLAGLEPITAGDLLIGGVRANDLPPQQRNIAMVFQSYALFPHLKARTTSASARRSAARAARPSTTRSRRRPAILNLLAISTAIPASCRAASASASPWAAPSCASPSVFLFDEPLSNLDAQAARADAHRDQGAAPAAEDRRSSMSPTTRSRP